MTTLATGIPAVPIPDTSARAGRRCRAASSSARRTRTTSTAAQIQQWNCRVERRLPCDIAAEVAYVGTRDRRRLRRPEHQLRRARRRRHARRQYFASAGTTAINDWASRTKSRYKGLQVALNRPFRNGLLIKGAYTWSQSKNMADEDGWVGAHLELPADVRRTTSRSPASTGPHVFQMGSSTRCRS